MHDWNEIIKHEKLNKPKHHHKMDAMVNRQATEKISACTNATR